MLRPPPHAPQSAVFIFEVISGTEWRTLAAVMAFVPKWRMDFGDVKTAAL